MSSGSSDTSVSTFAKGTDSCRLGTITDGWLSGTTDVFTSTTLASATSGESGISGATAFATTTSGATIFESTTFGVTTFGATISATTGAD